MHNFKNTTVIPLLTTIYPEIKKRVALLYVCHPIEEQQFQQSL